MLTQKTNEQIKSDDRNNRRKLILNSALRLFAEKDTSKVTIRQIARAAGVSVGTIYNYYVNIEELFLDVLLTHGEIIVFRIDEMEAAGTLSLKSFCNEYVSFLNENMTFYQMMSYFILSGDQSRQPSKKLDRIMRLIMDRVEAAIRTEGGISDTRLAAHALFSALNGLMISYARYPGRTPEDVKKHTTRLASLIADRFSPQSTNTPPEPGFLVP